MNTHLSVLQSHRPSLPAAKPAPRAARPIPRAFSLVEMLAVLVLLGLIYGLVMPLIPDTRPTRLREAARILAADLEFAQIESIAHPDNIRLLKLNTTTSPHRYWIAAASAPDTPIMNPITGQSLITVFGSDRASSAAGVTISGMSLGGDNVLRFDASGAPDQFTEATISLTADTTTLTVRVAPGTGEITVN